MRRFVLLMLSLFIVALLASSCTQKPKSDEIRISTNPWVGFTPFMYAEQKGWLKGTRIKFIWTVGLDENLKLYERGLTNGFAASQYELFNFKNKDRLKPFFLIDKSFGADVILSNRSISEIKNEGKKIDAMFEIASVNEDLFKAFITKHYLSKNKFIVHSADQPKIIDTISTTKPTLVISYEPYASTIEKKGFKRIASTRDLDTIQVVDALFVDDAVGLAAKEDVARLKIAFDMGVAHLKKDPKEYYDTIKGYLEKQSFEEFMLSTKGIEWLNDKPSAQIIDHLKLQGIDTTRLIK